MWWFVISVSALVVFVALLARALRYDPDDRGYEGDGLRHGHVGWYGMGAGGFGDGSSGGWGDGGGGDGGGGA